MMGTPGTPPLEPSTGQRLPVLDGVRGLAILLVMIHHFGLGYDVNTTGELLFARLANSSWLGVDLFFVLSGFLITGILLKAKDRPRYFKNFYMRRALRIFPLYYGTLFLYFVILPYIFGVDFRRDFSDTWWHVFYLSNFKQAFDGFQPRPLGILWSLSIEEQYYLAWPLLVYFLPRRALIVLCVGVLIATPAMRYMFAFGKYDPVFIYMNTLTRIDGIVAGSLLAIIAAGGLETLSKYRFIAKACAIAGMGTLFVGFSDYTGLFYYTWNPGAQAFGYSTIIMVMVACFVLLLTNPSESIANRALCWRPFLELGKYSYAMYIFHDLVNMVMLEAFGERTYYPTYFGSVLPMIILAMLIGIGITLLIALLTWNLWEKHFLKLKDRYHS